MARTWVLEFQAELGRAALGEHMEKALSASILELSSQSECLAHSQGSKVPSNTRVTGHQNGDTVARCRAHITLPAG